MCAGAATTTIYPTSTVDDVVHVSPTPTAASRPPRPAGPRHRERIGELDAGLARWETIKRFSMPTTNLTVGNGDLTPSLTLRRRVVEQRYATVLDGLYDA